MSNKYLLIVLSILPNSLYAAHILSLFAMPVPSQYAFIEPLLKELAARGHQITSITSFPQKQPIPNFRDVVVKKNNNLFIDFQNFTVDNIEANYYEIVDEMYNRAFQMCINVQNDAAVRQILDQEKIDLIILEVFFSESFFGLSEYLQAPIVGVSTLGTMISIDELVGNISPMSYLPNLILPLHEMTFWERLLNVMLYFVELAHYYRKYMPIQKQIYNFYYTNAKLTFEEAQTNFSLVLLNDHFSLTTPRPYVPNMIEVAGLNIVTNPEPLTPVVKQILDSGRKGVILISLDVKLNPQTVNIFLQQFKSMPQLILWKTSQKIPNPPPNVYVSPNFVEASILPHPNIQLYITPGGFLSIIESVYHGLPILGVVSTEKQEDYVDYVKRVGNGVSIKLHTISEKSFAKAFNELLGSPYYTNIAKTLSHRFRDQQNTPMERAVYWIEYVLRHKGARHLRNMGQNLTWWQFYNIDVIFAILCVFALITFLALVFVKILIQFLWKLKTKRKLSNVNKEKKV
ncbi:UDP-glucosyltransferase 2-like [Lucilia sericata]|uniref:UDP-glucosyltransferase 2-like n=1 Tax=Lucilia sericata TaxID=13632 RepID=UPI0018A7EBAD|nr:UDP-glucosyltransferase 2-like [Lucilia sericata]